MNRDKFAFRHKNLGIDTYKEAIIYLRSDCHLCTSEHLETKSYVEVSFREKSIFATINTIENNLLHDGEASISKYAQQILGVKEDDKILISHPKTIHSLRHLRAKIYGNKLAEEDFSEIISDITAGYYSDIHIAAFITACIGKNMSQEEILYLTKAMIAAGKRLQWNSDMVVDKHCVGGLPGNRTTPIVTAIVAAFGLTMPKTSSRAITSPAGTADAIEVLTNVELSIDDMQKIVNTHNACMAWGGSVALSPADDILIRIEKALDLDSDAQLIASILSKKIAAGTTHVLIDIPIGPTAKIRSLDAGKILCDHLEKIGEKLGIKVKTIFTDGLQPVGYGIGPALEARDFVAVLKNDKNAPQDLRERALLLSGKVLEFSNKVKSGEGNIIAERILSSGAAWQKFQKICNAQGGIKTIPQAANIQEIRAKKSGIISAIDNRKIAVIAKLAGAPLDITAGIDLHVKIGSKVTENQLLFSIHSSSIYRLEYALSNLNQNKEIITIS